MHKELPQPSEIKVGFSNPITLEKARQTWKTLRRNSLVTVAGVMAASSVGVGYDSTVDQNPDRIETPPSPTYELSKEMPSLAIMFPDTYQLNVPLTADTYTTLPEASKAENSQEKPKFSVRHLNGGEIADLGPNVIVAGDVSVNGKRFYDDNSNTGLIINLVEEGRVSAPYGADVLTPTLQEDTNAIIEQKKQEMIETGCGNRCSEGVVVRTVTKADTVDPTPISTSTEKGKTYLEPGWERHWVVLIKNSTYESKKRSAIVEYQGGDSWNVRTEIRTPVDSETITPQGSLINVPPEGVFVRVTMAVPSGAFPTCFDSIHLSVRSLEEGATYEPLSRERLDQDICVAESLEGTFTSHHLDTAGKRVVSYLWFGNSAGIPQDLTFFVPREKCSFPIVEQEFWIGSKRISPNEPLKIPRKSGVLVVMYSTYPDDKVPSPTLTLTCIPTFNRIRH